jgi:hypothetical protein
VEEVRIEGRDLRGDTDPQIGRRRAGARERETQRQKHHLEATHSPLPPTMFVAGMITPPAADGNHDPQGAIAAGPLRQEKKAQGLAPGFNRPPRADPIVA